MLQRRLDQRHQLRLVAGEAARDEGGAELQRHADQVDRLVACSPTPRLLLAPLVGGGGELALGQPVHAVVLDDVDHVHAAAHACARTGRCRSRRCRRRRTRRDRSGRGSPDWRRSAPTACGHARELKPCDCAEEIGRRLGRATDAGQLGDAVRRQIELEAGADDRGADRIMAAAGAQRGDRAFVVAPREAERVLRQFGMMQLGLWRGRSWHGLAERNDLEVGPPCRRSRRR